MKQSERDLLAAYIESQGIDDPFTISDIISKTYELKDNWDRFKSSETVRRAGDIMKYKNDPGAAKFTKVGEVSGKPIYQEDLDMIKLAKPFINKILKNKGVDVSELNTGPDTTENINEVRDDDIPGKTKQPLLKYEGMKKNWFFDEPVTDCETPGQMKEPFGKIQGIMWYFDPESQRFKPVIEHETEGLQCNKNVSLNKEKMKESFEKTQEANICMGIRRDEDIADVTQARKDIEEYLKKEDEKERFSYENILSSMCDTHTRKNSDYGDAAYKGYKKYGDYYFLALLHNKLTRLETLTIDNKTQQVKDESIDDTLLDMANYAVMYLESRHRND